MSAARLAPLWALSAAVSACGNDLDLSPQDVKDLRVLAICADTPELYLEAKPTFAFGPPINGWPYEVTAAPPVARISALVVDPREKKAPQFTYRVLACLSGFQAKCDPSASGTEVVLERQKGMADTLLFEFAPTAEMLNAWIAADAYRGYGAVYVMLDLEVSLASNEGERVRATKTMAYTHLGLDPAEGQAPPPPPLANTNPANWVVAGKETGPTVASSDEPLTLALKPDEAWETVITLGGADPEYAVPRFPESAGASPGYELIEENLFLDFYALAGTWNESGVTNRGLFGEIEEIEATYTAPKDDKDFPAILYFVSSDDRGGCAWRRATLTRAGGP